MIWSSGFDLGMILHSAAYVVVGLLSLWLIARAVWPPSEVLRNPTCGGCGYGVREILQGVCPECGGRYAKVGIATPSMAIRLRGNLAIALVAWTVIMLVVSEVSFRWLEQRAWTTMATMPVATVTGGSVPQSDSWTIMFSPWHSGYAGRIDPAKHDPLDFRVVVSLEMEMAGSKVDSGSCEMVLREYGAADSVTLAINLKDGRFVLTNSAGKTLTEGVRTGRETIEFWFRSAGRDIQNPAIQRSMQDAEIFARYATDDPQALRTVDQVMGTKSEEGSLRSNGVGPYAGSSTSAATTLPLGAPSGISGTEMALTAGACGAVYLIGCIVIAWRNRRLARAGYSA